MAFRKAQRGSQLGDVAINYKIQKAFQTRVEEAEWADAASHSGGGGLDQGIPDLLALCSRIVKPEKKKKIGFDNFTLPLILTILGARAQLIWLMLATAPFDILRYTSFVILLLPQAYSVERL